MTIIVGRATPNPRRAMFYLGAEGQNVERRVLLVAGLDLDRQRFTSANKDEVRSEAAYVAAQAEIFVETVPANRKARRKAAAEVRRQAKRDGLPNPKKPKSRNTWYGASLNPPVEAAVCDEDLLIGHRFLVDTAFRRYNGKRRGPVQEPAQQLVVLHRKPVPGRNPLHAHSSCSLATARGTMIPLHYDAVNTAVAAARWAADRGWPGQCSHYTVAVEHRVRLHYPEAHPTVFEAMIRRAEEGQRVGAIPADRDIHAMEPADLAHLIERRYRPRRDDADLEERISIYRLLEHVPSGETEAVLAAAGYRLALGDAQTRRGTPIYRVQPTEREDGRLRNAISLHRVAKAGLAADGIYERIGERMGAWIDTRVAGLSPLPIREVRRELEQQRTAATVPAPVSPNPSTPKEPTPARLAELRDAAICITLPAEQAVTPSRDGRIEIDQLGFVLLPPGAATDHASLRRSDAEEHEALAGLVLARRADDHPIEITGHRTGPSRIQTTIIALAANGVDPARTTQLRPWPDLAARVGQAFSATTPEAPNPNPPAGDPPAAPPVLDVETPPAPPPVTELPGFKHEHLNELEASVRRAADAGDLPASRRDLAAILSADWEAVRRPHIDKTVEDGRRAIRESVGVALVALLRAEAATAIAGSPVRALVENALGEVSSSARAQRARFDTDGVQAYLAARVAGASVEDTCRAAGPVERAKADSAALAAALRQASAPAPIDLTFASTLTGVLKAEATQPVGTGVGVPRPAAELPSDQPAPDTQTTQATEPPAVAPPAPPASTPAPAALQEAPGDHPSSGAAEGDGTPAPPAAPQSGPIQITPEKRAEVVQALNDRQDVAEKRAKSPPRQKALRLNPEISVEERRRARSILIADALNKPVEGRRGPVTERLNPERDLPRLRAIVRHTEAAAKNTKNQSEAAALRCGLETAKEAYRLVAAGEKRADVEREIALADQVRILDAKTRTVRILAATLAKDLPQLRYRVSSAAKNRNSAEDMIAIDGRLALQKLRERSKSANETAARLEAALRDLADAGRNAMNQGAQNGGYSKEQRTAIHGLRHRTAREVAWVPPVSDHDRTVRRRVEESLDPGRLPTNRTPSAFGIKAQIKATQADVERRQMDQEAARITQAARAEADRSRATAEARRLGNTSPKSSHNKSPSLAR